MCWYLEALKKYAAIHGRARRKEYWYFVLFNMLFGLLLAAIDSKLGNFSPHFNLISLNGLSGLYAIAVLLPSLAVTVRRLHDTGRSGWWLAILLIPMLNIFSALLLIAFLTEDSAPGKNRYGANPKEGERVATPASGWPPARTLARRFHRPRSGYSNGFLTSVAPSLSADLRKLDKKAMSDEQSLRAAMRLETLSGLN